MGHGPRTCWGSLQNHAGTQDVGHTEGREGGVGAGASNMVPHGTFIEAFINSCACCNHEQCQLGEHVALNLRVIAVSYSVNGTVH